MLHTLLQNLRFAVRSLRRAPTLSASVILTLALILVLYLMVIRMGRKITLLTRAIAVADARTPESRDGVSREWYGSPEHQK